PSSPPGRGGRENKGLRRKVPLVAGTAGGSEEPADGRKPKFHLNIKTLTDDVLDRFASIRIPGSKKERPPLLHVKQSHSTDLSSASVDPEDFGPKPLSEREIIALFEKMMEDMNLNEDKKMPLREKDFNTKKEMVMQYISTASKS
ncbi:DIAP3 protein, partial [Jacana jacana]|nr:DIAP3 protein [Jacana jacana]